MPYPPAHREETRARILDAARHLFNRRGFDAVSIEEVMAGAGLTRGGFYSYFPSKEALYAEAIRHFLDSADFAAWTCSTDGRALGGAALTRHIVDAYLSDAHLAGVAAGCPLVGMAGDVARGDGPVRAAYRQLLDRMADGFAAHLGPSTLDDGSNAPVQRALAVVALCVGGMVLARAVEDSDLAAALRRAAHRYAVALAGWTAESVGEAASAP